MIEQSKNSLDWFLNKNALKQLMILLLVIIAYLGYNFHNSIIEQNREFQELKVKVAKQDSIINVLERDLEKTKYDNILSKANEDTNPVPMWLVEVHTSKVLWVNSAYEKKYLIPQGTTRTAFIGTDGTYLYGATEVAKFKANNNMVFRLQRPITFRNEVNTTVTKFPVKISDYTYGIGGMEYIDFKQ